MPSISSIDKFTLPIKTSLSDTVWLALYKAPIASGDNSSKFLAFNIVKDKFDPEKLKKQSKDFTDAEKEAFDNVIDTGISATSERAKELGKGFKRADGKIGGITKFFGNNGGKFAGAALGIGAIFGVAAMASNASEERERKRQEMNQLLAAQSANIRGGY